MKNLFYLLLNFFFYLLIYDLLISGLFGTLDFFVISFIFFLCIPFKIKGNIFTFIGSAESKGNIYALFTFRAKSEKNLYCLFSFVSFLKAEEVRTFASFLTKINAESSYSVFLFLSLFRIKKTFISTLELFSFHFGTSVEFRGTSTLSIFSFGDCPGEMVSFARFLSYSKFKSTYYLFQICCFNASNEATTGIGIISVTVSKKVTNLFSMLCASFGEEVSIGIDLMSFSKAQESESSIGFFNVQIAEEKARTSWGISLAQMVKTELDLFGIGNSIYSKSRTTQTESKSETSEVNS